jgi:hypothetical protein
VECPAGVKNCTEDNIGQWSQTVRYGVIARMVAFWEWMGGDQGLSHMWMTGREHDIVVVQLLRDSPVDIVMFDQSGPDGRHPVAVVMPIHANHRMDPQWKEPGFLSSAGRLGRA